MAAFSNPAAYELYMGRWSRLLAPALVSFAKLPRGARVLDVGSGTGALSLAVLDGVVDSTVVGVEPAEAFVRYSRENISEDRARFEVGDASDLAFDDGDFDGTASLLILQELPNAPGAVRQMLRVTRPGGSVTTSQWDFAAGLPMLNLFWDTVLEVAPTAAAREVAMATLEVDYPDDTAMARLWLEAGLVGVETEKLTVEMNFASFDDYWTPFLSNVTATTSYIGKLDAEEAAEVKARLRDKLIGGGPDRPFSLSAYAWAVRGTVV
ncbi:MAG: class I SAM-dependent methyltransferase [Alphaproteobacteria bacterium]